VTSPLRAPFAHYAGSGGPAEVMEETRHGSSLRHSLGELLTCPFCLDMWVATAFVIGLVFAPRVTRLIAGTFTALARRRLPAARLREGAADYRGLTSASS